MLHSYNHNMSITLNIPPFFNQHDHHSPYSSQFMMMIIIIEAETCPYFYDYHIKYEYSNNRERIEHTQKKRTREAIIRYSECRRAVT